MAGGQPTPRSIEDTREEISRIMEYCPTILCTDNECRFEEEDLRRLNDVGQVEVSDNYSVPTLLTKIAHAHVLVTSCFAQVPAELIESGRRLRGIVKYGVGVDNIDLSTAAKRGLPVANCPDYGSGTIADHAFALLVSLARRLTILDSSFRSQGWFWPEESHCGIDLENKT